MGLPALRHDAQTEHDRRPHLRLVKPHVEVTPRHKSGASHSAAYEMYIFFAVIVGVFALLGVGRVWLSVQAAEASIDSGQLRREIKVERYRGDMLEIQQSALATPSRIQAIAGTTMGMTPASSVSYLDLSKVSAPVTPGAIADAPRTAKGGVSTMLAKALDVAAGEAQILLVGDVGLASSR